MCFTTSDEGEHVAEKHSPMRPSSQVKVTALAKGLMCEGSYVRAEPHRARAHGSHGKRVGLRGPASGAHSRRLGQGDRSGGIVLRNG
eukprot:641134-Prorocentrum_minimum.AAC.1